MSPLKKHRLLSGQSVVFLQKKQQCVIWLYLYSFMWGDGRCDVNCKLSLWWKVIFRDGVWWSDCHCKHLVTTILFLQIYLWQTVSLRHIRQPMKVVHLVSAYGADSSFYWMKFIYLTWNLTFFLIIIFLFGQSHNLPSCWIKCIYISKIHSFLQNLCSHQRCLLKVDPSNLHWLTNAG